MSIPDASTISSKGTTLKAAMAFVEAEFGRPGIDSVISALDEETRKLLTGILLPSSRYPLRHLVQLCETIDRVYGRGDLELCWQIGKFSGEYQVNLLHRVFLKVLSLQYWLKMAGATWKSYYSRGEMTARMGSGEGDLTLRDFNPISKAFCFRFGGWAWRIVELSKNRNVDVRHSACVLDGDPACVWSATWS